MTHVLFLKDKTTGQFYGSSFIEMRTHTDAVEALKKNGTKLLGRPLKMKFAAPLPGSQWPPKDKYTMEPYPPGCRKIFMANVSFKITDEDIYKLFEECGEIKEIRWLSHRDSGEFKGLWVCRILLRRSVCKGKRSQWQRNTRKKNKIRLGRITRFLWTFSKILCL
eukprot:UN24791